MRSIGPGRWAETFGSHRCVEPRATREEDHVADRVGLCLRRRGRGPDDAAQPRGLWAVADRAAHVACLNTTPGGLGQNLRSPEPRAAVETFLEIYFSGSPGAGFRKISLMLVRKHHRGDSADA